MCLWKECYSALVEAGRLCSERNYHDRLDKGEGTEDSTRLSFKRQNADGSSFQISEEQAKYLALDCISTWAVGEAVPPSPVEVAHTLGLVVLAHISSNGFPVDRVVRDYFERKIVEKMDERRAELISFGLA